MLPILVTLVVAFAFGTLLDRLKMPAGMMIGSLLGACLLQVTTGYAMIPVEAKTCAQIIAGAFIGAGVSRSELGEMRLILKPAAIILPGLLVINVVCGLAIYWTTSVDLMTAFIGCAPGGMSDMPMIAADLGADPAQVTLMQFARFLMGIALFPALIRVITHGEPLEPEAVITQERTYPEVLPTVITLAVATACGLLGLLSPVPSGTMAFAMIGSIALKFVYPKAQIPRFLRKIAQCLSGAFVGAGMTTQQLAGLPRLALPIVILLICYLGGSFLVSSLLVRAGCFNRTEAMLATTPAGASDMALISADLGVKNIKLVLLQVLRLIVVISLFPTILSFIGSLFV
ncbi:AbrB family transcriptional regulator [Eubacteriales bacterium OttesenSCG-928-A19]|nr:AbrB family transcriptional regulator [Eubacteriales bacterium OttesenSCG-928-A19]